MRRQIDLQGAKYIHLSMSHDPGPFDETWSRRPSPAIGDLWTEYSLRYGSKLTILTMLNIAEEINKCYELSGCTGKVPGLLLNHTLIGCLISINSGFSPARSPLNWMLPLMFWSNRMCFGYHPLGIQWNSNTLDLFVVLRILSDDAKGSILEGAYLTNFQ